MLLRSEASLAAATVGANPGAKPVTRRACDVASSQGFTTTRIGARGANALADQHEGAADSAMSSLRKRRFSSINPSTGSASAWSAPRASGEVARPATRLVIASTGVMKPSSNIFAANVACANRPRASPTLDILSCKVVSRSTRFEVKRPMLSSICVCCFEALTLACSACFSTCSTFVARRFISRSSLCSKRVAACTSFVILFLASA
mmetsp:Transcript_10997/g.31720  ORF Transcript_10997/g.31720 Transcript_10997/m.31720 type:complete len:206 (+) Transcript_10997:636-1253(+)